MIQEIALKKKDSFRSRGRRGSSGSEKEESRSRAKCYICKKSSHLVLDCPFLSNAQEFAKRQLSRSRTSIPSGSSRNPAPSGKRQRSSRFNSKSSKGRKNDKGRAYDAESNDEANLTSSDGDDSEQEGETAAISKKAASKIPSSKWVADSGASSHMTDQLKLFSGPLVHIRRRTIKVGGRNLYADYVGEVLLKAGGRKVTLSNVYYVPGLGVNLLSGKKLCESGLEGQFNAKVLRMRSKSGKTMVKATQAGGIYIVNWISEDINRQYALSAQAVKPNQQPKLSRLDETALPAALPRKALDLDKDNPPNAGLEEEAIPLSNLNTYKRWHRRFDHLGPGILRHMHKVTTLSKAIPTPKSDKPCETCALTKIRKRRNK